MWELINNKIHKEFTQDPMHVINLIIDFPIKILFLIITIIIQVIITKINIIIIIIIIIMEVGFKTNLGDEIINLY